MIDLKYVNIGNPETRVMEECAEVIHAICKAERFGWFNYHPDTPDIDNIDLVENEMADLIRNWEELKQKLNNLRQARNRCLGIK